MDDLQFYILFYDSSVISGRWMIDERLCAMEPCLWPKRSLPQAGLEPGTARSAGQYFTQGATMAPIRGQILSDNEKDFIATFHYHPFNCLYCWKGCSMLRLLCQNKNSKQAISLFTIYSSKSVNVTFFSLIRFHFLYKETLRLQYFLLWYSRHLIY